MSTFSPDVVCNFWFGDGMTDAEIIAEKSSLWWRKQDDVDAEIRLRFESYLTHAADGQLAHWNSTLRGLLALILLTDQLARNMYRGAPKAFGFDTLARKCSVEMIARGMDIQCRPIERVFIYLPFEHSEDLRDQDTAVQLFTTLRDQVEPELIKDFEGYLDFAIRHREIIDRFGRFPHRNAILGRTSTTEERAFLEQPGSSF